ncbi:MAG TPA: type II toxin-antitoxin system RelE/ParE family toxin [Pyrinomonadaceae bacterium]
MAVPLSSIVWEWLARMMPFGLSSWNRRCFPNRRELGAEVLARIESDLVQNPERGAVLKGTHGVRKARVADPASGRGKSGSYRYLYLYLEHAGRIHLLYLFSKGEQADLSPRQKQIIGAFSQKIRKER